MKLMKLIRMESNDDGVFGALVVDGFVLAATLEPPDLNNRRNASCIPTGAYFCRRIQSSRFGSTFEICAVPDRDNILFHAGNRVEDTSGCVLLGQYWGKLSGDRAVLNSGKTFDKFMKLMKNVHECALIVVGIS